MARLHHVRRFRGTSKTEDGTRTCESCRDKIRRGDPYIWWANRIGRSSIKHYRCAKAECRPRPSQYQTTSPHLSALMAAGEEANDQLASIRRDVGPEAVMDEIRGIVEAAATAVREVADGYSESADNIEDGFGHETAQSQEIREKAEQVESQADELEGFDFGEDSPPEEDEFTEDGELDEEGFDQAVDEFIEERIGEAQDAIDEGTQLP